MLLILSLHIFYTLLCATHKERKLFTDLLGKKKKNLTAVNSTGLIFHS